MTASAAHSPPPRIVYLGDVPVRALSAGPAVLFRLFETYPADRLLLAEDEGNGARQIGEPPPHVRRVTYRLVVERLLRTRWRDSFGAWFYLRAGRPARGLVQSAREFGVEAIVGMAHGYGWWTAHELAGRLRVPLHLIAHDDWRGTMPLHPALHAHAEKRFGTCYRRAATRWVVSPGMEESYRRRYGATGTVFYPIRSRHLIRPSTRQLTKQDQRPFTFAFAGDAGSPWARQMLANFANQIGPLGARLRIHYTLDRHVLVAAGLQSDNVEIVPFCTDPATLQLNLMAAADAVYLPMSFNPLDERNVTLCFPSKTSDYTATGLPLLIQAPNYSSVVRWANERPGVACVVASDDPGSVRLAAEKIVNNHGYRQQLAEGSLRSGWNDFDHETLFRTFVGCMRAAS